MTDIVINQSVWTPPGVIRMQSGQRMLAGPGLSQVEVIGAVYVPPEASDVVIDSTVKLMMPSPPIQPGVIQCAGQRPRIACEIDGAGQGIQGLQLLSVNGSAPVQGAVLDGLHVHDFGWDSKIDPTKIGKIHGVYFQNTRGARGTNVRLERILGGYALHFYPDAQGSRISQVTIDGSLRAVIFGSDGATNHATADNQVNGALIRGSLASDFIVSLPSAGSANTVDYGTAPAPGYGYQDPPNVPLALLELGQALDNFVSQLGYSVDRTKRTHVYKALLALGGSWHG